MAGGRVALLPFILAQGLAKTLVLAIRGIFQVVHEILHPHVDGQQIVPSDTYWAAAQDPPNA